MIADTLCPRSEKWSSYRVTLVTRPDCHGVIALEQPTRSVPCGNYCSPARLRSLPRCYIARLRVADRALAISTFALGFSLVPRIRSAALRLPPPCTSGLRSIVGGRSAGAIGRVDFSAPVTSHAKNPAAAAPLVGCIFSQGTTTEVSDSLEGVENIINMLDEIMEHMDGFSSAEEARLSSITETLRMWRYVTHETYESPETDKDD